MSSLVEYASEPPALLAAADANLAAYMHLLASTSDGGGVEEGDGYLAFAGGHEYPGTYTNGVIRTVSSSGVPISPAELLARADAFFGRWRRPYVVWVRAHADRDLDVELQRRGFEVREPADGSPAVLRESPGPVDFKEPDGVDVVETHDEDDYRTYLALVAKVYGWADADLELAGRVLFSLESLRHPGVHVYVARLRDTGAICGGTQTFIVDGAAHSAWSVTDPDVRGRGVGSAFIPISANEAYALGADFMWGVSSQVGAPIWNKVGLRTVTRYKRYLAPMPEPVAAGAGTARRRRRTASEE